MLSPFIDCTILLNSLDDQPPDSGVPAIIPPKPNRTESIPWPRRHLCPGPILELTRRRSARIGHVDIQGDVNRSVPDPRFDLPGDPLQAHFVQVVRMDEVEPGRHVVLQIFRALKRVLHVQRRW
jgi:hypothetical protein